jgi:hypothetical protein
MGSKNNRESVRLLFIQENKFKNKIKLELNLNIKTH